MQKEIALGKGAVQGLHEMARAGAGDQVRQDLLRLALRLRAFDLMADLSDENLFVIAKFVKEEKFAQGQKIFDEVDEGDALYLIEKGEVHLSQADPLRRTRSWPSAGAGSSSGR